MQSTVMAHAAIDDCWNRIGVRGDHSCPRLEQHTHCRNCPVYSAAAADLLDGTVPAGSLEESTRYFAQEQQLAEAAGESAVLFRIGQEWLGLRTTVFREIAAVRALHTLPHRRDRVVQGLVNIRGELLVNVSLAELLGIDTVAAAAPAGKRRAGAPRLLVIGLAASRVAVPVDEVHGIHHFHPRDTRERPATVARATATYTRAVLPWNDRTVGLLDDQLLFYVINRSLSSATAT